MPDSRDDYRDVDRPPDAGPKPDPTGLRPRDRIQIVGGAGVFMGFAPGVVAVLYLGRPETWTAQTATLAFGIAGLLTGLYMTAGGLLVVRGAGSKPVQGDAVRYFNLLIVGPLLVVVAVFLIGPYVLLLVFVIQFRRLEPILLLQLLTGLPLLALQTAGLIRHRQKIIPALHAWLDPTE